MLCRADVAFVRSLFCLTPQMPPKPFNPEDWLTPNSYNDNHAELTTSSAIYLLVRATWSPSLTHKVLYVGMSTNLAKRFRNHEVKVLCDKKDGKSDYVQVYFKRCPKEALRRRERAFIKAFNPPYNLQHRERGE